MTKTKADDILFVFLILYVILFSWFSIMTMLCDFRFLVTKDDKSEECGKIYPQIWLSVISATCVLCTCGHITCWMLIEIIKIDRNHINNDVIMKEINKNICNKIWIFAIFTTILQVSSFIAQICVYQIINIACPVVVDSALWINDFNNTHYNIIFCFLYSYTSLFIIVFIRILFGKIVEMKNMRRIKKENENNIEL